MAKVKVNEDEIAVSFPKVISKIKFKSKNQKRFYKLIENEQTNIIMAHALAGAGKTYISLQKGLEFLLDRQHHINKLIIINPTVDVGNEDRLGFLPGTLQDKIQVHNESAIYILHKIIGEKETNKLLENGKIEFKVINYLRGMNLDNAYVVVDEAQNCSPLQLKTVITRISDTTKLIIQGDLSQCDKYRDNGKPAWEKSGFYDVWKRLGMVYGVGQVEFTREDCIRSGIVKRVLEQYEKDEQIYLGETQPNLELHTDGSVDSVDDIDFVLTNMVD